MVERSLSMREVPGSMPGSSILKKMQRILSIATTIYLTKKSPCRKTELYLELNFQPLLGDWCEKFYFQIQITLSFRLNCLKIFEMQRDLSMHNSIITYVRMAERSKAPDSRVTVSSHDYQGAFWSTNVGVGSNPTSDKIFFKVIQIHILTKTQSTEPDLNQRPKDTCQYYIYSPPLYQLSYRW